MVKEIYYGEVAQKVREKALSCGRDPQEVTVIAVSKKCSVELIRSVYHEGCREFGESRIQESLGKMSELPNDCIWHFIGSLQSNKVGKAISSFQLIHSVDSIQLARKISQMSQERGIRTSILLQVNTSGEVSKHGLSSEEWEQKIDSLNQLSGIKVEGLMTMAPFTEDHQIIRDCFHKLYVLRENWRSQMKDPTVFQHLSMGMSHDYMIAIEEGATLLRIGSAIFDPFQE